MASDISKGNNVFMVRVEQSKALFLSSLSLKAVASRFLKNVSNCVPVDKVQNSKI